MLHEEKAPATVTAAVDEARRGVKRWDIEGDGWPALLPGLKRIYRQGFDAFRVAEADPRDENLHEWRKRVKDLWYALDMLQPVRPTYTKGRAEQAHGLADALGDDHDFAVLGQLLSVSGEGIGQGVDARAILSLIDRRRHELQHDAFDLGREVYDEKPKAFVARMERYWQSWRSGMTLAQER